MNIANFPLLGIAAVIGAAVLTLPIAIYTLPLSGEFQYQAAMTVAFREHMQWGSQLVWSFGPYGYMNEPAFVDFNTWALAFAANLAGHVALFGALALFLHWTRARTWLWVLLSVVVALSFDRYTSATFARFPVLDSEATLVAILLLYLASETASRKQAALLAGAAGVITGYLFLDKGTYLMVGVTMVAAYLALNVTRGRAGSVAALVGGVVVGYLVLWLLAGQSIRGIPDYFRTTYEVIAGYTAAMSQTGEDGSRYPMLQLVSAVAMLAAAGLSLLITAWRRDWSLFRLLLLTLCFEGFAYKNAFVRIGEHHSLEFWALAAVLSALVLVRAVATRGTIRSAPTVIATVTIVASLLLVGGLGPVVAKLPKMQPALASPANLVSYRRALSLIVHPDRRLLEKAQVNATLRAAYPLPPDVVSELRQGSVAVVPYDLLVAFAYGFQWDPQPVLLSYSAYRPYLDHLDAQHYLGPQAPRFVLYATKSIDGRYPLFDEPETYRVLFDRYQVLTQTSKMLVLERRPDGPLPPEHPLGSATGRLGQWIPVPPHGDQRIYGRVQLDYALLGLAMNLVLSPPELHIRMKYGGGGISPTYRFIPADGPDGLELSTYAPDNQSVERMAQGQFDQPIEAIQIVADSPAEAYEQMVYVSYFTQPVG